MALVGTEAFSTLSQQRRNHLVLGLVFLYGGACLGVEVVSSFRQRLNLHKPETVSAISTIATDLAPDQSGCSCYVIKNDYCCWQGLCVCHNVCYNGSALLGNFKRRPCVGAMAPEAKPGQKETPLLPIRCRKTERFRQILNMVLREAPMPDGLGFRYPRWRETRRSIMWREGTTYLQPLDETCANIAHFLGKVAQLLLINNASSVAPGLPYHVDRFMFPRAANLITRLEAAANDGWHVGMLRQLVGLAAKDQLQGAPLRDVPGLRTRRFYGRRPLLGGVVEFERAFEAATERQPMCFDHVVIPGYLKAITYPSGPEEAGRFQEALRDDLRVELPTPPGGETPGARARKPVSLLYIVRDSSKLKRRVLTPESEAALSALLGTLNFKVTRADLTGMSFRAQFDAIQRSEIILGLHGAALANAAFARNRSVVVEVVPWRVFHQGYYFLSVNAGATYMMHQCRQGTPQERDGEFEGLSVRECLNSPPCKQYFLHLRNVELTRDDLLELGALLMQARQVVVEARWNLNWAGRKLRRRFDSLCVAKQRDIRCRMDLIRSPIADPSVECVLKKDCEGRVLRDDDSEEEIL